MEKTVHKDTPSETVPHGTVVHENTAHESIGPPTMDTKVIELKPTDVGAVEHKPTELGAVEHKPTDVGAVELKPTDVGAVEHQPTDVGTVEREATESENMSNAEPEDLEVEDTEHETPPTWKKVTGRRLTAVGEWVASRPLGQSLVKVGDKTLMILEHSVRWFVPEHASRGQSNGSTTEDKSEHGDLIRPVPWYVFLPFLMLLRVSNACLRGSAWVLGKEPVHPREMVAFLQRQRRNLRAIKYQGLKNMRQASATRASVKSKETAEDRTTRPTCLLTRLIKFARLGPMMVYIGYWSECSQKLQQADEQIVPIIRKRKFEEIEKSEEGEKSTECVQDKVRPYSSDSSDPDFEPTSECSDTEDEQQAEVKPVEAEDKIATVLPYTLLVPTSEPPRDEDSADESSTSTLSTVTALIDDESNPAHSLRRSSSGKDIYYSPISSERSSPEPCQLENPNDRPRAKSMEPKLPMEAKASDEPDAESIKSFTSAKSAESIQSDASTLSGSENTSKIKGKLAKFFPRKKQSPTKQNAT